MRKKLRLGNSDFKSIISSNAYYIDKSLLIDDVLNSEKDIILFPRPRRFGKTLNISMLRYFFDKSMPENIELFKDLKIWQTDEETKQHCCKYPVIFMTFKDTKAQTWEKTYKQLVAEISRTYKEHRYLLEGEILYKDEKIFFENIINRTADETDFQSSIAYLSEYLYRYHKQYVVILMDEYDAPIHAGYKHFYDDVIEFMRNLMSGAYKDNPYLFKGVITGILRVSKESIFSGLNNLSVYSILHSKSADKFGFTENEIKQLLNDFNVKTDYAQIKKWYNGYKIGRTEGIYNPWSILNYIAEQEQGFQSYWTHTSSNDLIKDEMRKKDADYIRQELITLINGGVVKKDIEENFVFKDLQDDKDLLWTLLLFSGYLTTESHIKHKTYTLRIPNYELKFVFQDTVMEWLKKGLKIRKPLLEDTINHLINNELQEFEYGFKEIMLDTFSYYDTAKKNEYVYQAYVLGLLAILSDDYIIKSNKESGEGRYDIMLIPHDKSKNGVVMELKQIDKQQPDESDEDFQKRINKALQDAASQIERHKYYNELIANKIPKENIIKIPVVFAGKEPFILK